MPIILIVAGTLSPSNGVDAGSNKSPWELIFTAFVMMLLGIIAYLIFKNAKFRDLHKKKMDMQHTNKTNTTQATVSLK